MLSEVKKDLRVQNTTLILGEGGWGKHSLQTADAFPVVASLPPEGEKRRPEMRLLFAG